MVSIAEQSAMFIGSVVAGFIMGMFFDMLRALKKTLRIKKFMPVLDSVFWFFCLIISFAALYITGDGIFRWFAVFGFLTGVTLYMLTISKPTMKFMIISLKFIKKVVDGIKKIIRMIFSPFIKVLSAFAGFFAKFGEIVHNLQKNSIILLKKHLKKI